MNEQIIPCCSYHSLGYEPNAALIDFNSLMQTRSKSSAKSASSVLSDYSEATCSIASSQNYYKPPANKKVCTQPITQVRRPTPYHFDSKRAFSSTLQSKTPAVSSAASYPSDSTTAVIEHQRRLIRSAHFARNQWVKPSLHRLTLIQEYIADLKILEESWPEPDKVRIVRKIQDLINIQLEEAKGTELTHYSELVQEQLFGNFQLLPTVCFDCEGKQINHQDLLEVEDPYSGGTQQGRTIQVLNQNIVLVRLASTGRVVTKFGFEVKLLTEI